MLTSSFRWVSDESVTPSSERVYHTHTAIAPSAILPSFLS